MYRRATAGQSIGFVLIQLDGTAAEGADVTVYRVVDGGDQEAATGTVEEKGNGQYAYRPSAADVDGSQVSLLFLADACVPVEKTLVTTRANPDDEDAFGLTNLETIGASLSSKVLLTVDDNSRLVDPDGNPVTQVTFGQAVAALFVNMLGDRSGVGTRTIAAAVPGIENCTVSAYRASQSTIEMTITLPAES